MQDPMTASEIVRGIQTGRVSASDVVSTCLSAIEEGEEALNAWVCVDDGAAMHRARELDALDAETRRTLPLIGVPIGVKDIIDTADLPTELGSPVYAARQPAVDAQIVAALRAAGAIVIGKTATTEFACFSPARTTNPIDHSRTPGGSSSGSAAAVRAGMVPIALGTQTAGSIVRPASFCGVYGLKPTSGLLPRGGTLATSESLDTLGFFARSPEDLDLVLTAATDARFARTSRPLNTPELNAGTPQVAVLRWGWDHLEPEAQAAFDALVLRAESLPGSVSELVMPIELAEAAAAQFTIQWFETALALEREWREHPNQLSQRLRDDLHAGRSISERQYLDARRFADEARWRAAGVIADFDAVLSPSTLGVPPVGLESTGDPLFCRPWTLFGMPALAVPTAWSAGGLPVGVQLTTTSDNDRRLLIVAEWLAERPNQCTQPRSGPR